MPPFGDPLEMLEMFPVKIFSFLEKDEVQDFRGRVVAYGHIEELLLVVDVDALR